MTDTAKYIREKRIRLGLSQEDLSKILGVSSKTVVRWEAGSTEPKVSQLAKIEALKGNKRKAI